MRHRRVHAARIHRLNFARVMQEGGGDGQGGLIVIQCAQRHLSHPLATFHAMLQQSACFSMMVIMAGGYLDKRQTKAQIGEDLKQPFPLTGCRDTMNERP